MNPIGDRVSVVSVTPEPDPALEAGDTLSAVKRVTRSLESPKGFLILCAGACAVLFAANTLASPELPGFQAPTALEDTGDRSAEQTAEPGAPADTDSENPVQDDTVTAERGEPTRTQSYTLKRRETLSGLMKRAKVSGRERMPAILALEEVADLRRLRAGQKVDLTFTADKSLDQISIRDAFATVATARKRDQGYESGREAVPTLPVARMVEGQINDSLYLAAKRAGTPEKIITDVIRMMSYAVDFQRDIRKGDRFRIYFERSFAPTFGDVEEGRVLHAELTLWRGTFEATLHTDDEGRSDYYTVDGESLRKTLLVTPVDGARLSSGFGRRKHPILGYTKMHKGLDFAAPRGTPIMAGGDGVVEVAKRNGSYGKYIRIRHGGGFKTAYAHLNGYAKGIRAGKRVKQGDIIGYIGTTGRSTGPHLHYEIHKAGRQVNPLSLKLPTAKTLKGPALTAFIETRTALMSDVDAILRSQAPMLADAGAARPNANTPTTNASGAP